MTDKNVVATNIRLPRKTLEYLKIMGAKRRKSVAQMVREAIEQTYGVGEPPAPTDLKRDSFYKLVGAFKSGIADGAVHHDRDIYGG